MPIGVSSAVKKPSLGARRRFSPSPPAPPTAWERGVVCMRRAAGSPCPASRERGLADKGTRLCFNFGRRSRVFLRLYNLTPQPPLRKRRGGAGSAWHERSPLSACGEGGKGGEVRKIRNARLEVELRRCTLISLPTSPVNGGGVVAAHACTPSRLRGGVGGGGFGRRQGKVSTLPPVLRRAGRSQRSSIRRVSG